MSIATTHVRAAAVLSLTAAVATGAVLPSAASPRPAAVKPTTISAAASAAKTATAEQAKASKATARAETAMERSRNQLDEAKHSLVVTQERLTRLSALVDAAAEQRLGDRSGLLEVAEEATQVAADVAGVMAPVVEALDPLAEAVDTDVSGHRPPPEPSGEERDLRLARAQAVRENRVAADEVARTQKAVDAAAATLASAREAERRAAQTAAAATKKTEMLAASLGIGKRLVRPGVGTVSSPYGMRTHPLTSAYKEHTGLDFQYADGLAYAAAEGTVAEVVADPAYGNLITIAHGMDISTRYAHLALSLVRPGEHVSAGQVVGRIGSTGVSTGPHLHFEIQVNGHFRDPAGWLGG
jgi:murein DD-endopeptidase MepM/ murein hydrolase activator NlpD